MKSLQARMVTMIALMLGISLVLSFMLVKQSMGERTQATRYDLMQATAGHLNSAAAWQAIERGVGATILGSKNPPSGLLQKFRNLGQKGDAEVALAQGRLTELQGMANDPDLQREIGNWNQTYGAVQSSRANVRSQSMDKGKWVATTSANIVQEFLIRTIAFAPTTANEQVLNYNSVVRANVATLADNAGIERALLGGVIATGNPIPPKLMAKLKGLRSIVESSSTQVLALKGLSGTPAELKSAIQNYEQLFLSDYQVLREKVYAASAEGTPYPLNGSAWIGAATKAINSALAISNVIGELSAAAAADVKGSARNSMMFSFFMMALAVVVFAAVIIFLRKFVIKPINTIIDTLGQGSVQISSASGEIASSSQSLSSGATEQAASLEETSASLEEMASMSRQNAENAGEANRLANESRVEAEKSSKAMTEMTGAMAAINESSNEISKIIKVIEEISFQTNLLALNAAVEAARAGEHGKGFAVVAEEVRNLAQRSSAAAKDTASLIEDAVKKASEGSTMADNASMALVGIVESVKKVSDLVAEITTASDEQAKGVDQVNGAVSQMDSVTQKNAASAEESAAASEELNAQADSLNDAVSELIGLITGQTGGNGGRHLMAAEPHKMLRGN